MQIVIIIAAFLFSNARKIPSDGLKFCFMQSVFPKLACKVIKKVALHTQSFSNSISSNYCLCLLTIDLTKHFDNELIGDS